MTSQPTDTPRLVAVHVLPKQRRPLRITAMRPLSEVACDALVAADRLLAESGAGLAVQLPAVAALAHNVTS